MPLFKLKNGKSVNVRIAETADAAALLDTKLQYLKDITTVPLYVDEYSNTVSDEKDLISKLLEEANSCLIVATYEDQIIGNIDIIGNQRRKLFHTAVLGMGILESYRNLGLGRILMDQMISWAKTNESLNIIWLEVYDSNIAGKKLYNNTGFEECGRMKNFFHENGKLIDNIRMIKYLDK